MRIQWKKNVELTVSDEQESFTESVRKGELDDVGIVDDKGDTMDLQFGCGGVSFNVQKDWFEVLSQ